MLPLLGCASAEQPAALEAGRSFNAALAAGDTAGACAGQSEFLAVASMAALSIYLRQRGYSESKPVGSPHAATGEEG